MTCHGATARRGISVGVITLLLMSGLQTFDVVAASAATPGRTVRASLGPDGSQIGVGVDPFGQAISGDGQVVAFVTAADLSSPPYTDTNGESDLYRRDLRTGHVDLVTADSSGRATGGMPGGVYDVDLDEDGSRVAFESLASNLVAGDTNGGARDIFVREFGEFPFARTTLVSVNHDDSPLASPGAFRLSISDDGDRVAFAALAPVEAEGDDGPSDASPGFYIRELGRARTLRVTTANPGGSPLALSGDGRSVAYAETGDGRATLKLWRSSPDSAPTTVVINDSPAKTAPNALIGHNSALSYDGSALAFESEQSDLVPGDTNGRLDGFVYRVGAATPVTRVTVADDGTQADAGGHARTISRDGSKVVFFSSANDLAPGASGFQVYVRDMSAGSTRPASVSTGGALGNGSSINPDMSRDGSVVSFASDASNLVDGDSNELRDVFVHDLPVPQAIDGFSLTVSPAAQKAGVSDVPTGQIDLGLLPLAPGELEAAPLRSSPLRSSPLRSSPLRSSPLRSSPLRSSPLRSSPLRSSPLRSSPVLDAAEQLPPMPLSTVPLLLDGGWAPRLVGTPKAGIALQTVTLQQVIALADEEDGTKYPQLSSLTLADVDVTATPLRSSPLQGFLFAGPTLQELSPGTDWCAQVTVDGTCDRTTWTLLDLVLAGATPSQLSFVSSLPVREADLTGSPIAQYDVGSVDVTAAGLGGIAVADLPADMFDCSKVACSTATLAQAVAAGAIVSDATLSAFGRILSDDAVIGSATFGDLVRSVVDPAKVSYAEVGLGALVQQAPFDHARLVTYTAAASAVTCTGGDAMSVTVQLPAGFRYKPGSSRLSLDGGEAAPVDDPAPPRPVEVDVRAKAAGAPRPLLRWQFHGVDCPGPSRFAMALSFDAAPGVTLGVGTASAVLTSSRGSASALDTAPVTVGDALEPNDSADDATPLVPGSLYVSHISSSTDVDTFRLPDGLPAGTRVTAVLSHLPADFDLFLDGPAAAPLRSSPLRSSPLRSSPLEDLGVTGDAGGDTVEAEPLQDIPLRTSDASRTVLSQSASADTVDERVTTFLTRATSSTTPTTLAVTHHLGSSSRQPYMLQVTTDTPPELHCARAASPFAGTGGVAGTLPSLSGLSAAQKAEKKTLFLVNAKRLGDSSSKAEADAVLSELAALSARPEVGGLVLPVEGDSAVASAYSAWDASRCDPEAANDVVRAIGKVVDGYAAQLPELRYITFVGDDDIVPFARIPDGASLSNQRDYYSEVVFDDIDNPISAAYGMGYVLSDNPLLAKEGVDFLGHQLPLPDYAGGRLVETPSEIIGIIDQYVAQPRITLDRTLVTGYDFLSDSTDALNTGFTVQNPGGSHQELNNETWTRTELSTALADAPTVAGVNAHYDHSNTLPAAGNASTSATPELFSSTDLLASGLPAGGLLFSLGCQGGLSVPGRAWAAADATQAERLLDFAQAASQKKVNGFFGNTGYGYGESVAVAYSERLLQLFGANLDGTMTLSQAVTKAKKDYLAENGLISVYIEKVLNEATFYGLPFVAVGHDGVAAPAPAPPAAGPSTSETFLGTPVRSFTKTLSYAPVSTARGDYFTVPGEQALIQHHRPIQPATLEPLPAPPAGTQQGDLWFTGLVSLPDQPAPDPVFVAPTVDQGAYSPEPLISSVNFPVSLGTVTPGGAVALFPGQFRSDPGTPGQGTQRRFSRMDYKVFYPSSLSAARPTFTEVDAVSSGAGTLFRIGVDQAQNVGVLYRAAGSNTWTTTALTQVSPGVWAGSLPSVQVQEYLVQAVNDGRVATTRAKGLDYRPAPAAVTLTPVGTPPATGATTAPWYRQPVRVEASSGDYEASVDGAPFAALPLTISDDGAHRVDYRRAGTTDVTTVAVPVDQGVPTVTITNPPAGAHVGSDTRAAFSCADATSGIASCRPLGPFDTSPGEHTFTVKAVDRAGWETTKSVTYRIVYAFEGFFAPVDNPPVLNVVQPGRTVPVKFRLRNGGAVVTDTSAVKEILITELASCPTAGSEPVEETVDSAPGGLVYHSADRRFQYNWKTSPSATGCQKLTFRFADGTSRHALFQFKR